MFKVNITQIQEQIANYFRQDCGNLFITNRGVGTFVSPTIKERNDESIYLYS